MGKTIKQILDRAYYKAGIKQEGIDLTSSEYTEGINEYNDLIKADWASGLNYTCAEVSAQTDDTHLPSWANSYIQNSLAMSFCAEFNKPVHPLLPAQYEVSLRQVEKMTVKIPTPYYSSIMPAGGGNSAFYNRQKYFGNPGADDLIDGNGSILQDEEGRPLEDEVQAVNQNDPSNGDQN